MIYESEPWRARLRKIEKNLKKYNTAKKFRKDDSGTYSTIEQDIFLSAFIIRKLIDCKSKVKDSVRDFEFEVKKYTPIQDINFFHRWPQDGCYDFTNFEKISINERTVCNFLIHSYVFWMEQEEGEPITGFVVSTDRYRNKLAYYISWKEYMEFIHEAAHSEVTQFSCHYNKKQKDYVFVNG